MIEISENYIKIDTPKTTLLYQIKRAHNNPDWDTAHFSKWLEPVYYGKRIRNSKNYDLLSTKTHTFNSSVSCMGNFDSREPLISVENSDGSLVSDFAFYSARKKDFPAQYPDLPSAHTSAETVEIIYYDKRERLRLINEVSVFSDTDVIVGRFRLVNEGKKKIRILRLMSLQLDLYGDDYTMYSLDGEWGRERMLTERKLGIGVALTESLAGMSSHAHNPFFMLKGNRFCDWYGFNLLWSGNHKESVEISPFSVTRVLTGINDFAFSFELSSGETFVTPQAACVYSVGRDEITEEMHCFVNKHIVRGKYANTERPVVINNWEATYFDFTASKIRELASRGAEIGAELFVLDDGWFSTRTTAVSGLGDWWDNKEKTGGGLKKLSEEIRATGLKFGIWLEPEMVNPNSELFRRHPEYAMLIDGRPPMTHRRQYVLDLVNPKVRDYLFRVVSEVIERCSADYVKWDFNRKLTEFYSPVLKNQGEYTYRYQLGLYDLIGRLTARFPEVLFESCAGGGGRYDLGLLCYMPQIWTSDDTDARMRLAIQEGTLIAYPQSTMVAHVSICPNHLTQNVTPLESVFNIASVGILGYEYDLTKATKSELEIMKKQIDWYKKRRSLLQYGKYYVLDSVFDKDNFYGGWIIVSPDKKEAVAMIALTEYPTFAFSKYRFKGLNEKFIYRVELREQNNISVEGTWTVGGDILMYSNTDFGGMENESSRLNASNSIFSRLLYFKSIN